MVHLVAISPLNLNSTTLQAWDSSVRQNFDLYQKEIDRTTYQLQRSQRGYAIFGSWFYPAFAQRDLQNLKLLKMKQQLGQILPEEVAEYKPLNLNIAKDLNQCFNARWAMPSTQDVVVAASLQVFAHMNNLQFSWRAAFLVVPWFLHVQKYGSNHSAVPAMEFMSWLTQVRKCRSQIERQGSKLDKTLIDQYHQATQGVDKPLIDLYQEIVDLALKQQPHL